ncbi:hypothetical protein LJC45_00920 [Alistipes sp. OttesenSCG-928-B03]|nr:hypothetical protein [Alistipes sp. OttesenSCG-928-B03]
MKKILTLFICALALAACDDIFEKDLTDKTVTVVAPVEGAVLEQGEATFLWRGMEGATAYHITIVSPSFDAAAVVVADEKLTAGEDDAVPLTFTCNIGAGQYQWSIRAMNCEYESRECRFSFTVVDPDATPEPEEL